MHKELQIHCIRDGPGIYSQNFEKLEMKDHFIRYIKIKIVDDPRLDAVKNYPPIAIARVQSGEDSNPPGSSSSYF